MHHTSAFGLLVQTAAAQTIAGGCNPAQRHQVATPILPVLAVWVRLAYRRLFNS